MGYRLHFEIPNIRKSSLELGKMYKNWEDFLNKYYDLDDDLGLSYNLRYDWQLAEFTEFVKDLKDHNNNLVKNDLEYTLYNMDLLDQLVELAIENKYIVRFVEY